MCLPEEALCESRRPGPGRLRAFLSPEVDMKKCGSSQSCERRGISNSSSAQVSAICKQALFLSAPHLIHGNKSGRWHSEASPGRKVGRKAATQGQDYPGDSEGQRDASVPTWRSLRDSTNKSSRCLNVGAKVMGSMLWKDPAGPSLLLSPNFQLFQW